MKNVQISEELVVVIMRYFMLEQEEMLPQIKQGLEKKLDAMVMRELYTKYKTAPTEEEKEKALLLQTLEKTGDNRSKAARLLNVSRTTLYEKLRKYHIID